jgi:hypothetical protein
VGDGLQARWRPRRGVWHRPHATQRRRHRKSQHARKHRCRSSTRCRRRCRRQRRNPAPRRQPWSQTQRPDESCCCGLFRRPQTAHLQPLEASPAHQAEAAALISAGAAARLHERAPLRYARCSLQQQCSQAWVRQQPWLSAPSLHPLLAPAAAQTQCCACGTPSARPPAPPPLRLRTRRTPQGPAGTRCRGRTGACLATGAGYG